MGINKDKCYVLLTINSKVLTVKAIQNSDVEKYKNFNVKKLIKRGVGYGLNFTQTILELLDINPENDLLDISIDSDILTVYKKQD